METRVLIRSYPKPNAVNTPPQWCSWWNLIMIGQLVSEIFMFESVDGRTDGHRLESHTMSSPWAFGSGELKIATYTYLHFQSKRLMNLKIFANIYNPMKQINMIDSCQAHLPMQFASNTEIYSPEVTLLLWLTLRCTWSPHAKQASCLLYWLSPFKLAVLLSHFTLQQNH